MTTYRQLREPWTHIHERSWGKYSFVDLYENHKLGGTLTVQSKVLPEVLNSFFDDEEVLHVEGDAKIVQFQEPRADDLLDSDGELVSYRDLVEAFGPPEEAP